MDDSYYYVYIECKQADEPVYVCRSAASFRLSLHYNDAPLSYYSPWNYATDVMGWIRLLTSQIDAESKITYLRESIRKEFEEFGTNVPVTVVAKNGLTDTIVGSFTYVPNPPH